MKRIHYASGALLTGDEIADVIVRYAAALAHNDAAAEVIAPAMLETGETGEVSLLLGPASQILVERADYARDELRDEEFVAALQRKILELAPRRATFVQRGTEEAEAIDLDYL